MARYYDLDSLRVSDINVGTVMFPRMERCILLKDIESAPTADVVPKSEVDEIIGAFDTWLYKHYNGDISDWDLYKLFVKLKKKYE